MWPSVSVCAHSELQAEFGCLILSLIWSFHLIFFYLDVKWIWRVQWFPGLCYFTLVFHISGAPPAGYTTLERCCCTITLSMCPSRCQTAGTSAADTAKCGQNRVTMAAAVTWIMLICLKSTRRWLYRQTHTELKAGSENQTENGLMGYLLNLTDSLQNHYKHLIWL